LFSDIASHPQSTAAAAAAAGAVTTDGELANNYDYHVVEQPTLVWHLAVRWPRQLFFSYAGLRCRKRAELGIQGKYEFETKQSTADIHVVLIGNSLILKYLLPIIALHLLTAT
jgi:hypothetical protein